MRGWGICVCSLKGEERWEGAVRERKSGTEGRWEGNSPPLSLSLLSASSYWASETVTNQKTEKLWSAPGPDVARIRVSQGELWVGRLLRGFGRGQSHAECFARSQRETSGKKPVLTPSAAPLSETEITKWWRGGGSFYTNLGHRQCTLLLIFQIIKGYIPVF